MKPYFLTKLFSVIVFILVLAMTVALWVMTAPLGAKIFGSLICGGVLYITGTNLWAYIIKPWLKSRKEN